MNKLNTYNSTKMKTVIVLFYIGSWKSRMQQFCVSVTPMHCVETAEMIQLGFGTVASYPWQSLAAEVLVSAAD